MENKIENIALFYFYRSTPDELLCLKFCYTTLWVRNDKDYFGSYCVRLGFLQLTIDGTIYNRNISSREFFHKEIVQIRKLYNETWISFFDERFCFSVLVTH